MRMMSVLGISATLFLAACHKDSTGPAGPLDGSWSGSVPGINMNATFGDHGGAVSGSGDFDGAGIVSPPIDFDAVGTDNGSSFSVTLTAQGRSGSVTFAGTVTNSTTLTGTLSGSLSTSMVLTRN
jgi:hypothetical protein